MSKIHYFQRYSSVENTVTNNTLQLISRIYNYSSIKASQLLSDLTDEAIDIGIEVTQQRKEGNSVPDATIIQRSFKVLIESKVDSGVNIGQLLRHASSFANESLKILILLTIEEISNLEKEKIIRQIQEKDSSIIFKNITYESICSATDGLFQEYEYEMTDLISDYREYCSDVALFDESNKILRVVPCGSSIKINIEHGIYFHPSDRGYSKHKYLGIYAKKKVQAIWEIESVFDVSLINDKLIKSLVSGNETDKYDDKLRSIIIKAKEECGYNIKEDYRFFCGSQEETSFVKISSGGIMGARMMNIENLIGNLGTVQDIAMKLNNQKWK